MPTPVQKARIGAFLVTGAALLIGALAVTVGFTNEPASIYYLRFQESVDGLARGSQVKYRGLPIGVVEAIYVNGVDNSIQVEIEVIDRIAIIYQGAVASIRTSGLVGATFIQVDGGEQRDGRLSPGSDMPTGPSLATQIQTDLPQIIKDLRDAVTDLRTSMNSVASALTQESVQEFVGQAKTIMQTADESIVKTRDAAMVSLEQINSAATAVVSAADTVTGAATTFDKVVAGLEEPVQGVVGDARQVVRDLKVAELRQEIAVTIDRLNRLLSSVDAVARNLDVEVETVGSEVVDALVSLQTLLETIERNPSSLIFGPEAPPVSVEISTE
jgi:phospholipid/cholesterol/gamma-HCH transport system substrate-binding protein